MKKAVLNFIFGLFSSAFMRLSAFWLTTTRMDTVYFSLQVGEKSADWRGDERKTRMNTGESRKVTFYNRGRLNGAIY